MRNRKKNRVAVSAGAIAAPSQRLNVQSQLISGDEHTAIG
jgi:hypothetical protein